MPVSVPRCIVHAIMPPNEQDHDGGTHATVAFDDQDVLSECIRAHVAEGSRRGVD